MGKYQYWKMDNDDIMERHVITASSDAVKKESILEIFKFIVKRYKDQNTQREQLEISAMVQNEPSGKIVTNLIDIEKDLPKLRAFGIVLSRSKYVELCHLIGDKYYFFAPIITGAIDNVVTDEITQQVFEMLCCYIADNGIKCRTVKQTDLYNIPVEEFNRELQDSAYRPYNLIDVKKALADKGYTVTNKGKFDYVVNVGTSKVKMVSLKKEHVNSVLENRKSEQ